MNTLFSLRAVPGAAAVTVIAFLFSGVISGCAGGEAPEPGSPQLSSSDDFHVEVSGAFEVTYTPARDRASVHYEKSPDDSEDFPPSYVFRFYRPDQEKGSAVTIVFYGADPPAAGTHELSASMDLDGTVAGLFSDRETYDTFAVEPTGTITIERDGDQFAGRFQFKVGESMTYPPARFVNVEGEFKSLTLEQ